MTCRELLNILHSKLDADSSIEESEITMTNVYDKGDGSCVARIVCPVEGKLRVMEIQVKTLVDWEGLKISQGIEHLVP